MNDSDKINDGETAAGDGARKRPPPTIELTAAEVSEGAGAEQSSSDEAASAAPEAAASQPPKEDKRPRAASLLLSVIAGALAALAVLGAAHFAGWPPVPAPVAQSAPDAAAKADVNALGARLAKIETDAAKPAPPAAADSALVSRLGALEASVAALRDELAAARAQAEKAMAGLDALKAAPPAAAPVAVATLPDVSAIEDRLGRIERDTAALAAKSEAPAPAPQPPADDQRLRRVAAATLLESAVRDGTSYVDALAAAKASADNASMFAPLDAFAAGGVPSAPVLCRELLGLLPKSAPKPEAPPSNLLDRLRHSAMKLVRVSRVDAPTDDAALARVAAAAKRDDLEAARREVKQLAPAERAPLQAWLDKADARDAARAAARQFAADAMAALAKPVR
jgi:hypothetical protein